MCKYLSSKCYKYKRALVLVDTLMHKLPECRIFILLMSLSITGRYRYKHVLKHAVVYTFWCSVNEVKVSLSSSS